MAFELGRDRIRVRIIVDVLRRCLTMRYLSVGVFYGRDVVFAKGAFDEPQYQRAFAHAAGSKHHHSEGLPGIQKMGEGNRITELRLITGREMSQLCMQWSLTPKDLYFEV